MCASSVAFGKVYRLGLASGSAKQMLPVKTQDPWISLLVNSCLCYCISLREDCRMFVYHGYECLTDPRLYKADHCCLSLSRAIACSAVF